MHADRNQKTSDVPVVPAVDETGKADESLFEWVKRFARPMRCHPRQLTLGEFDHEFFLIFDFEESPEATRTCDIKIVGIWEDYLADCLRIVANANKYGVMRMLAAIGIEKFSDETKAAFYELNNPLRRVTTEREIRELLEEQE